MKRRRSEDGGEVLVSIMSLCHAQDATISSIWHEGLVRDRSASCRFARMDIVTSTYTEKMSIRSWLTLATSYIRVTLVHYINIKSKSRGPTTDENKREKKNDVHPCYPRLPAWNPS